MYEKAKKKWISKRELFWKKKRYTHKSLIISDKDKKILAISPLYIGKNHDFNIFKNEKIEELFSPKKPVYLDNGFEGVHKLRNDINFRKPKKKRKNKKLNGGEKLGNRLISKVRVKVEHAISGIKKFGIVSKVNRMINHSRDTVFKIACGLWNLSLNKEHSTWWFF